MRVNSLKIVFSCFFLMLVAVLLQKQFFYYEAYKALSEKNRIRIRSIPAPRGVITDRHSTVLAANKISFEVAVIPQEVKDREFVFNLLADVLGRPVDSLFENYKRNCSAPFAPVVVARDITKKQAINLEERSLFLPGVIVITSPLRFYPLGEASAHIIGYLGEINAEELYKLKPYGYAIKELIGKGGVEKTYNAYLKGERGGVQVEVDNRGRQVEIISYRPPEKGKDIQLTIDAKLQEVVYNSLQNYVGAVTVVDPRTGEILAMVSSPSFDSNLFARHNSNREVASLLRDPQHPFINRNIQATYPPGSLFKILIASAALQEDKINRHTTFTCTGSFKLGRGTFGCWDEDGHGPQTATDAIKHSCNVFFYNTGLRLGVDLIYKYSKEFGFGQMTGIDLPYELEGLVPSKAWKKKQFGQPWYEGETVNYSIGQGYLTVTPLQTLKMVSAVANEGHVITPYLTKSIDGISASEPSFTELKVDRKNLRIVKEGMEKVTKSGGTGYRVAVEGLNIAGKTATAQAAGGPSHAWFSGFAPAKDPKVALIVVLEHGGKGGLGAVDIARDIFSFINENYNLNEEFPFGS